MTKKAKNASTYQNRIEASKNYKLDSFSVNSLQNFCVNAISGKYTKVTAEVSENKVNAANNVRDLAKVNGMTVESFRFDNFLKNYERLTSWKLTEKKGKKTVDKTVFSLNTYLSVCEKFHKEITAKVIIQENKPDDKTKENKLTRSQSSKIAQLSKQLKSGKIDQSTFDKEVDLIKKVA